MPLTLTDFGNLELRGGEGRGKALSSLAVTAAGGEGSPGGVTNPMTPALDATGDSEIAYLAMSVDVDPDISARIMESARDGFDVLLQVINAEDARAVAAALPEDDIFDDLSDGLDGPGFVQVVSDPTGTLLTIDAKGMPIRLLESIPEILSGRLTRAGIENARITWGGM